MNLKERIFNDMIVSMKARNKLKTGTLRMLRSEIINRENEKTGAKVDDSAILSIIQKMIRQRKEAAEQFEKCDRAELALGETAEIVFLEEYLPPQMTEDEIKEVIFRVKSETGASSMKDMGNLMRNVMKQLKESGKIVDGKKVNILVKIFLS
jgi:uncharacterized protein